MSEIDDFLMRRGSSTDNAAPSDEIDDFLMRRAEPTQVPPQEVAQPMAASAPQDMPSDIPTETDFIDPQKQQEPEPASLGTMTQVSQGMIGSFIDLLGLPGDAANWAMEKAGLETRFHGGESMRQMGARAGVAFPAGQEPDTAAIKSGQYIGMGLEFLVPFLGITKAATLAKAAPGAAAPAAVPTTKMGLAKDVAATMGKPFVTNAKLATATEFTGGMGAGVGAYYGGKEYGATGEMIGGLIGGAGFQVVPSLALSTIHQARKSLFPMTKAGGKIRAAQEIQRLAETKAEEVAGTIANESRKILPGAKISPVRLSGDKHLIAMEESLLKEYPQLAHEFERNRAAVNDLARAEIKQLGGNVPIEKTQAYYNWRVDHIKGLIDKQVDSSLLKAKGSLDAMGPQTGRVNANKIVNDQIKASLEKARGVERDTWNKVDKSVSSPTNTARDVFRRELENRAPSADPKEIESFIPEFLGRFGDDGAWQFGKFDAEESVHQLTTFRSRLTTAMREEAAKESPNWNKHRIMDDIQEGILQDLAGVEGKSNLGAAVEVSRKLNQKFKSDTLNNILGHHKSGGRLAPELTLESMGDGSKAAVMARDIVTASPESKPMIEDFLKSKIATSLIDKSTGRLNYKAAKKFVDNNEMTLDLFPQLRTSMNHAIGQEERAAGMLLKGKARKKKLLSASIAKLGSVKPGRVLSEILTTSYPQQAMKRAVAQSNKEGREGIKNDIMNYLLNKSKTGSFNDNNMPVHSGRKMAFEWADNKKIFSQALTPAESKRVDVIVNTLVKNEKVDAPPIGDVMAPNKGFILFIAKFLAAQRGAEIGKAIGPGTIQVPGYFAKMAEANFGKLDTGTAKQLLVDSVQDRKLFDALLMDVSKPVHAKRVHRVLQGWMLSHTVKSLETTTE